MLFTTPFISALAFAPSVIATVVFVALACRYHYSKKNNKLDETDENTLSSQKKATRLAGITALTLWILLGACNALLAIAVMNM